MFVPAIVIYLTKQQEPPINEKGETEYTEDVLALMARNLTSPENGNVEFVCQDTPGDRKSLYPLKIILTTRSEYYRTSLSPDFLS